MVSEYRHAYNDSWQQDEEQCSARNDQGGELHNYPSQDRQSKEESQGKPAGFKIVSTLGKTTARLFEWHRITPIRKRYVLTRSNCLRLRYLLLVPIVLIIGGMKLSAGTFEGFALPDIGFSWDKIQIANIATARETEGIDGQDIDGPKTIQSQIASGISQAAAILTAPPPFKTKRILTLQSGQTLAGLIQKEGVGGNDAYLAVKAMSKHFDPRKAKVGQTMTLKVAQGEVIGEGENAQTPIMLKEMLFDIDPVQYIKVSAAEGGTYKAEKVKREVSLKQNAAMATIHTSVYGSAAKYGIPSRITAELIRIYSWDVDFQRDIRQGDKIEVLYETYETEEGSIAKYGQILYANLSVGGQDIPVYRFKMKNGDIDYFTEDGWSIKKALMKTPIDGARLSSGFGMRKHPVLGYNKMHKGVDFAAPTGTPIYAAGDGTVEYAGRKGGYGNYIRIRHNSQLKTAYAHMHRFAKKMGKGKRVKQGQVIGYVGTTGRSTGPHLHYEVLKNNVQVNPNRVDLPTGEKLKGTNLANLKNRIKKMKKQYKEIAQTTELVKNDSDSATKIQ